jgi:hypothetical protein
MTQDALTDRVGQLADPRWERDDLSVSVLGMLLYGFALGTARMILFLDMADIDAAVLRCLTERVGAAAKWSAGLVAEAAASAFDKAHHPGQHERIWVGHSYIAVNDRAALVENIVANIESIGRRAGGRT